MEITKSVCYKLVLVIDTKSHKVLFAEANKDFVDFLFSLLSFPLGTLIGIVAKDSLLKDCRLGKLYGSVENLHKLKYMLPKVDPNDLLKPKAVVDAAKINFPLWIKNYIIDQQASKSKKSYVCHQDKTCVAHDPSAICPHCCEDMSLEVKCGSPPAINAGNNSGMEGFVGFVDDAFKYMLMDDLEVKSVSFNSVIAVLKNFNVEKVGDLEEKVVFVCKNEGLKLLKALLQTNSVLTEVFLERKTT